MVDAKRHHYLPEFYLQDFTRDGWLWIFDRPRAEFRRQRPRQVAVIGRYYEVDTVRGERQPDIERLLSQLEAETRPLIQKVDGGELLTDDEKVSMSLFAASMYSRVPHFRREYDELSAELTRRTTEIALGDPDRAAAVLDRMRRDTGMELDVDPRRLSEFVTQGEYDIVFPPEHSIQMMLEIMLDLAQLFVQMNWSFYHPPSTSSFVTTDSPFILIPPRQESRGLFGVGMITPGAIKILPLSQTTCLLMGDHGSYMGHSKLNREQTRAVNLEVVARAYELVVARDEPLIRNLVEKTRLEEAAPTKRFSRLW